MGVFARAAGPGRETDSDRAPEGLPFEPLADHPRLGELVGDTEKFSAHNAAEWKHGLLAHVPKGVVLDEPLYVRVASPGGSALFCRRPAIPEPESRFVGVGGYASGPP